MRNWVAGLVAAAGAVAALCGTAAAQAGPSPPQVNCEQGQFTAAEGAFNRDNFIQFVVHYNKAVQCQFDVPPDFHAPH